MGIKTIIFDFGGVYFSDGAKKTIEDISRIYNKSLEKVTEVFMGDIGGSYRKNEIDAWEFWSLAKEKLGITENSRGLIDLWHNAYSVNEETVKIIKELKHNGYELLYLSDNAKERVEFLNAKYGFLRDFKDGVFSHEAGMRKPDERMYSLVLSKTLSMPNECVYIDDKEKMLAPARSLGINAIRFISADQLRFDLQTLGVKI